MTGIVCRRPRPLAQRWSWPLGRLFEDVFEGLEDQGVRLPQLWGEGQFVPALDVTEDDEGLTLTAEMPGLDREDLEVSIDDHVLTLRGEKKEEETTEGANVHRVERRYGHFERHIRLPAYVDTEKVEASYKDGVLRLRMPKAEAAKAKIVQIK